MENVPEAKSKQSTKTGINPVRQHNSNPFSTAITGIKNLFSLNTGTLVATVLFNIGLGILAALTAGIMLAALMAYAVNHAAEVLAGFYSITLSLSPQITDFSAGFSDASIFVTWIIGAALLLCIATVAQAVQTKLATSTAQAQHISFGELFKKSFARILPLLGFMGLAFLAFVVIAIVLGLIASALAMIAIVLGILVAVALFYFGIRLTFTIFAIVEEAMGPIQAIKRSWQITDGHFAETIGILAVGSLIVMLPTGILSALTLTTNGNVSSLIALINSLLALIIGTVTTVAIAERFEQLRQIADGKIKSTEKANIQNYLAIVYVIVASIFVSIITPTQTYTYDTYDIYNNDSYYDDSYYNNTDYNYDDYYNDYNNYLNDTYDSTDYNYNYDEYYDGYEYDYNYDDSTVY
ncbi:MAG: hypothetical protein PVI21_06040 [Candidatus Woesebacteria bacterium]|jgi:hypothetical protein